MSPDLAELAADAITDKSKVVVKMEKWRQFEISKQAEAVVEDFVRVRQLMFRGKGCS